MEKPASVRVARESDANDVASLTGQLGYQVNPPELRSRLSRILERSDQRFLVAEDQREIVGWLHASVVEHVEADPFVVVNGLVVDKRSRRRGIGRMLMESAETWAKERHCSVVRLRSTAARTGAHQFYERLGYKNIKTQYSFAKPLGPGGENDLSQFVPIIDTEVR